MLKTIVYIFIFLLINSCTYENRTQTSFDHKKYKVRVYKDSEKQEVYANKYVFKKNYSKMNFEKYHKKIDSDTFNIYSYFQFDSVRIYINNIPIDGNEGLKYSGLFSSGLVTPKILVCALNSNYLIPKDSIMKWNNRNDTLNFSHGLMILDTTFIKKQYGWTGSKIYISNIKELTYLNKKTTKVFLLEHKIYNGGPTNAYYFIEITNEKANKNTSFTEFIKGAKLTFIKYTYTLHEI